MKITYSSPFTMIANDIIQSKELNIYQKMVYMVLCSHANQETLAFRLIQQLQENAVAPNEK